ncbi:Hypothetical predicted protein [Octopus vulgaris]|uniref:Uncharacterized protein n=1 Tax=Octopus vulgaris TaxID=6645 RepID=A0AA36BSV8_OCTVU|nr:Hypothetical predicted protein [Octopus vulgaris]
MKIQMNEYFPNSAHNIQTMPIYSSPASNEGMLSPVMEFANSMTPPTHTAPPAGDQMMMNPNQVITYSAPGQWIQQTTLLPNQSTLPVQHYHMAPATINSPPFYPHSISNPNAMSYMHSCGDSLPPQKSMSVPAMQSYKMEQRRQQSLIQIVNPNTGEDISKEILTNRMDEDLQELDSFRDNQINLLAKVTETTTTHESQNPVPGVMVPYLIHPIHLQEVNPVQQIMFESHIPLSHTSENIQEQSTTQTQIEMFDEEQEKPINCNNGNISVQTVIGTVKEDPVHRPALPQSENMMKTVSTENQSTQESSEMLPNKIVDSVEEFVPQNTVENETLAPEEVNSVQRHNQVSIVYPVLNKCHSKMSQTNAMDTSTAAQAAQARTENHPIESNSVEQPFQVGLPSYAEMTQHQIPSMTPLQVTQVQTPLLPAVSDPNQLQTRQPVVAYLPVVFYLEGTIPNGDPIAGPRSFQGSAHPQPLSAHGAKPTQGIQVDI